MELFSSPARTIHEGAESAGVRSRPP
jgi:hypothetical protein